MLSLGGFETLNVGFSVRLLTIAIRHNKRSSKQLVLGIVTNGNVPPQKSVQRVHCQV